MKLHPRTQKVQRAKNSLRRNFWKGVEEHDLTYMEAIICVSDILQSITKYGLRAERHPDNPDKKADVE